MRKGSGPCRESAAPSGRPGRNWGPRRPPGHCPQRCGSAAGVFVSCRRPAIGGKE